MRVFTLNLHDVMSGWKGRICGCTPFLCVSIYIVRVTRSLVLYVCCVDRCLSFCVFSFGHCVVCSSSIYGF